VSFGIRFRFSRDATLKYIAHLDMLRLFERTLRRSGLPVAHSQGFNPRMKLVFGLPMAMGLTSGSEYADVELEREVAPDLFLQTMNRSLPQGMKILAAVPVATNENIMLRIGAARYWVLFRSERQISADEMQDLLQRLIDAESVPVMKKGKKGLHEVNVRPLVFSAAVAKVDGEWLLEAFLSAGANDNLRPDLFMEAWQHLVSRTFQIRAMHREELYASMDNEWVEPTDPRACGVPVS